MNQQDLRTLLDYHYWARDRLLDALEPLAADQLRRDMGNSFKSIHETVAHVYADTSPGAAFEAVEPDMKDVYFSVITRHHGRRAPVSQTRVAS